MGVTAGACADTQSAIAGCRYNCACVSGDCKNKKKFVALLEEEVQTFPSDASSSMRWPDAVEFRQILYDPGCLVPSWSGERKLCDTFVLDATPLGRGSYGEVTGATHRETGVRRAIKSVGKAGLRRYVWDVSGFVRREVDILRRLDHPNIVRMYEAFEDDGNIYLVLELCEGGDLLERVMVSKERLPEHEAAALLLQMLGAMQHLCLSGVVHRDLKPENFMFTRREPEREPFPPETAPLKLIDFGLSRRLSGELGVSITPKIGTTEYMAPEAFAGRVSVALADRADIWSMGVVLHVMFTGHFPSAKLAENPKEYFAASCWRKVTPPGMDLLGRMLRQDPSKRPSVTDARRHRWLLSAFRWADSELLRTMPHAIKAHVSASGLRRLALAAAGREVDDNDVFRLRNLFRTLELECDGNLVPAALVRLAAGSGPLAALAKELVSGFECIDADGSGVIEWTEFVAIALGYSKRISTQSCMGQEAELEACKTTGMPPLRDDVCWRSFDLLSQSSGVVTGSALCRLLAPEGASNGSHGTGSDDRVAPRLAKLVCLVKEVEVSGIVTPAHFLSLLRGD